jgi:hypothetical protein
VITQLAPDLRETVEATRSSVSGLSTLILLAVRTAAAAGEIWHG